MTTRAELNDKLTALTQRTRNYSNSYHLLHEAVRAMGPHRVLDGLAGPDQRAGAFVVLDWLDQYLIPEEIKP